ncbi:MAG: histidine phosphatase family protein [Anaerolineae bacterium]
MIRIIIIRHGRTAWNAGEGPQERFRGIVDLPLAAEGLEQAEATAQRLRKVPLAAVYSSPLERAVRTAEIIAAPHNLAVRALPGLSSMDYGDWAGQLRSDVARRWPDLYRRWRRDPFSITVPGGDSAASLRERAVGALQKALAHQQDHTTIALVSHQAVTKTLACTLVGLPDIAYWRVHQDLCNLSLIDYEPETGVFSLSGSNDTCHLGLSLPCTAGNGVRIILVRHGQTAWNQGAGEERFRGRTDLPLNDMGLAQASTLADRLGSEPIAAIYASPLLRTRQTVAPLATALDLFVEPEQDLIDINYGRFQGLSQCEAAAAYPEHYKLWLSRPSQVLFPAGESLGDIQARLRSMLDRVATAHPNQSVVLAGHQMVNKVLACTLLGLDLDQVWRLGQDTASVNVYQHVADDWHVLRLNDTCHLADVGNGRC